MGEDDRPVPREVERALEVLIEEKRVPIEAIKMAVRALYPEIRSRSARVALGLHLRVLEERLEEGALDATVDEELAKLDAGRTEWRNPETDLIGIPPPPLGLPQNVRYTVALRGAIGEIDIDVEAFLRKRYPEGQARREVEAVRAAARWYAAGGDVSHLRSTVAPITSEYAAKVGAYIGLLRDVLGRRRGTSASSGLPTATPSPAAAEAATLSARRLLGGERASATPTPPPGPRAVRASPPAYPAPDGTPASWTLGVPPAVAEEPAQARSPGAVTAAQSPSPGAGEAAQAPPPGAGTPFQAPSRGVGTPAQAQLPGARVTPSSSGKRNRWTREEVLVFLELCEESVPWHWAGIEKKLRERILPTPGQRPRSQVDLKDKWRNLSISKDPRCEMIAARWKAVKKAEVTARLAENERKAAVKKRRVAEKMAKLLLANGEARTRETKRREAEARTASLAGGGVLEAGSGADGAGFSGPDPGPEAAGGSRPPSPAPLGAGTSARGRSGEVDPPDSSSESSASPTSSAPSSPSEGAVEGRRPAGKRRRAAARLGAERTLGAKRGEAELSEGARALAELSRGTFRGRREERTGAASPRTQEGPEAPTRRGGGEPGVASVAEAGGGGGESLEGEGRPKLAPSGGGDDVTPTQHLLHGSPGHTKRGEAAR